MKRGERKLTPSALKKQEPQVFEDMIPAVFDSMAQCASQAGIPLKLLKSAKRNGCPAFKSNRVYLRPLLSWLFGAKLDDKDWKDYFNRWHALREELAHNRDAGETLIKSEVHFAISKGTNLLFSLLDRMANVELPPDLKGKDERGCQLALLQAVDKAKQAFIAGLGEIGGNGK